MFGDIALYDLSYGLVSDLNEEYKKTLKLKKIWKFSVITRSLELDIGSSIYHI